jgi:Icc-related predicted phosphoesterase
LRLPILRQLEGEIVLVIRIAALGDVHATIGDKGRIAARLSGVNDEADLLLLPGDLTDGGRLEEGEALVKELAAVRVPIYAVLGNHDYAARRVSDLCNLLRSACIKVMDGEAVEMDIAGETLGLVGARGFKGGFGTGALGETFEPEVEVWVALAQQEAAKIERGLRGLGSRYRVVMLHYAPIHATVEGENPEIFPFMGSSRLCEPIDRLGADLVVHGHAHHGTYSGRTPTGIPVYNVCAAVLQTPYALFELGK